MKRRQRTHRPSRSIWVSLALAAAMRIGQVPAQTAPSTQQSILPSNGKTVAGNATIRSDTPNSLTITQTSNRAIIDWTSFSVGAGNTVNFQASSASDATLNRVTGNTPSTIAGSIRGNESVYLVNPNGIAITKSGTVNLAGDFIASTLSLSTADFLAGRLEFSSKTPAAALRNAGRIATGSGTFVGLLGGAVSDSGTIAVPYGHVALASGQAVTLDPSGQGFLQVTLPAVRSTAAGSPLIDVSGQIQADGGMVSLSAGTLAQAFHNAVNVSGSLQTHTISGHEGLIVIDGGVGGEVNVSGSLDAGGATRRGGTIVVSGEAVNLASTARLNASGASGGLVLIGGDIRGGADPAANLVDFAVRDATTTRVARGAQIDVDGTAGAGGQAVIWSNQGTDFGGSISGLGNGGDGGDAEVSSHGAFNYDGTTNLLSTGGKTGNLLLDPYNVTISTAANANQSGFTATGSGATINRTTLQNSLASANVTVATGSSGSENGDITVASALNWSANTTLTLNAAGSIHLNSGITNSGAGSGLTLNAAGSSGISGSGALANSGTLMFNVNNASASGTLSGVISGAGTLTKAGSGRLTLTGANTYTGTTTISSGTLTLSNTTASSGFTVASGAVLQVGNSAADYFFNPGANSSITGSGTLQKIGTNTVTFGGYHDFTWNMSAGGLIDVQAGTLIGGSSTRDFWTTNLSSLNVASGATFEGIEANVRVDALTGAGTVKSGWPGSGYSNFTFGVNNGSGSFSGVLADQWAAANFVKAGSGTQILTGANTYTGTTTINSGTLTLSNTTASSGFTVASGAVLQVGNSTSDYYFNPGADSSITGAGTLQKIGTNTVTFGGYYGFTWNMSAGGLIDVQAGTLVGGSSINDFWTTNLSSLNVASGATFEGVEANVRVDALTGAGTVISGWPGSGYSNFTFGVNNGSGTFTGVLADQWAAANFVKTGSGTQILTGANTYTGTTTVDAGTLNLAGSWNVGSGTATTSVANGATLSGTGVITAGTLADSGLGAVNLTGDNLIGALSTSDPVGAFTLRNAQSLSMNSLTSNGVVSIAALGSSSDLTLASGATVSSSASGTAVTLAAGRNFINDSDAGAVQAANGRWLVYSAASSGDTFNGLDSGNAAVWNATYGGTLSQSGNRYVFATQPTLTISSVSTSKTYGQDATSSVAASYSISGYDAGVSGAYLADNAASTLSGTPAVTSTGSASSANAGTYAINALQGSLSVINGYALDFASTGTLTVGKAGLTITGATTNTTYNGLTQTNTFSTSGLVGSDSVTAVGGLASGTDAGTYADALSNAAGSGLSNYTISYVNGSLNIGKAPLNLTYTANGSSSVYGSALSGLSGTVSGAGFVNGEGMSALGGTTSWGTTATASSNAGSYAITGSGLTSGNYAITAVQAAGNGSAYTVDPATLTITANNASKTYDAAAFSGGNGVTIAGLVNGDTAASLSGTLAYGGLAQGAVDAGTYSLTASGLSNSNYTIAWSPGTLTIGKAGLTITGATTNATYNALTQTNTFSTTGLAGSDSVTGVSGLASGTNAGSYADALSNAAGSGLSNYTISYVNGSLNIGKAPLSLTGANNATTYTAGVQSNSGATLSGLQGSDNFTITGYASGTNAGTYADALGLTANGGTLASNYTLTVTNGNLTIGKAGLSITGATTNTTYNGLTQTNTFSTSGLVGSDSVTAVSGLASGTNAGTYADALSNAAGSGLSNYTISYVNGSLNIGKAGLTVTGNNSSAIYDGAVHSNDFTTAGLLGSDSVTGVLGLASGTNAGSYSDALSGAMGSGLSNYNIAYVNGGLTIGKAALTLTYDANPATSVYGSHLASLSGTVTGIGFVDGQGIANLTGSVVWSTAATSGTNVGHYQIAGSGLGSGNYAVTVVQSAGNATAYAITPAPLTIAANDQSKVYGQTLNLGADAFTVNGLVNGNSVTGVMLTSSGAAPSAGVAGGPYAIVVSNAQGAGLSNYTIDYVNGALTVKPAPVQLIVPSGSSLAGFSPKDPGFAAVGLQNGQNSDVLTGIESAFDVGPLTVPGTYSFGVTGALTNPNYQITSVTPGVWKVLPSSALNDTVPSALMHNTCSSSEPTATAGYASESVGSCGRPRKPFGSSDDATESPVLTRALPMAH